MFNINEVAEWVETIEDLETTDPLLGGVDGHLTQASQALANRTQWLKNALKNATGLIAELNTTYNGVNSVDHTVTVPAKTQCVVFAQPTRNHPTFDQDEGATVETKVESSDPNITIYGMGSYIHNEVPIDTITRNSSTQYVINSGENPANINIRLYCSNPTDAKFGGGFRYQVVKIGDK